MPKPMVLVKDCVLNVMAERQTQDRRLSGLKEINRTPDMWRDYIHHNKKTGLFEFCHKIDNDILEVKPRYQVGEEVYVAEGYQILQDYLTTDGIVVKGIYLADDVPFEITLTKDEGEKFKARQFPHRAMSGRFMYKSLARTFRKITGVGVELLHAITLDDIRAEGITTEQAYECNGWMPCYGDPDSGGYPDYVAAFEGLWNSVHGAKAYDLNPYVFVYKFDKE